MRSGKKLAIRFRFELHEIMDGKDIPVEKRVISMEDLALILYAPHIKNSEIRRIVATAIYQTEMLIAESNMQARKNTLK